MSKIKPEVSVIIPTYNRNIYLKNAVSSVLNQTFKNIEILICDDGSTDGSEEMIQEIEDHRIHWISGKNSGGPAVPRNRGIKEARGEWLAFLDSDDIWELDKLEQQLLYIKRNNLKASSTNARILKNEQMFEEPYFNKSEDMILSFDDMLRVNHVICSSMIIHKSIAKQFDGFPENKKFKAIEDYVLWLSATILTQIYYINKPLVVYRDEPHDSIRGEQLVYEQTKYNRVLLECLTRIHMIKGKSIYKRKIFSSLIKKNSSFLIKKIRKYLSV